MGPKKGPKAGAQKKKEEEPVVVVPAPVHHKEDGFTVVVNKKKKPEHSEQRTDRSKKDAPKAPPKPKPAIVLGRNQIRVTREVPLDSKGRPLHWVIIGNKGETIKWIREQSGGVEVEIPPPGDNRNDYNLVGTPDQIQKATSLIEELFKEETTNKESTGEISTEPVKLATVPAPKLPPRVSDAKTVVAPKLLASQAAAKPPAVVAKKTQIPKEILSMPLGDRMSLDIPLPFAGAANKHKSRLNEIAEETNTSISFDQNWVSVAGFERNCLIAETKVLSALGQAKYEVAIPTSKQGEPMLGLVIGPKGSTLAEIREKSGNAVVLMPDDGNGRRLGYVTIYGTPQEVQHAVSVVCKKLKIGDEVVAPEEPENVLIVDQEFPKERRTGKPVVHLLIGKEGSTIKNISAETGVKIEIPRNVRIPDKYTLRGTEEQIKAALGLIRREFEESGYDLVMPKTVDVAPKDPYADCIVIR